jgi:hypothetical protein
MRTSSLVTDPRGRVAALLGVLGAAVAAGGTFLGWSTIEVGGLTAPGGSQTGWEGRDGRTVLAGAVVGLVAAVLVALRSRKLAPKIALIVAGGVTSVIAVAGILDTAGKADKVQEEFAIPADRVQATVGSGVWLVVLGGVVQVAAGVLVRSPSSVAPVAAATAAPAAV